MAHEATTGPSSGPAGRAPNFSKTLRALRGNGDRASLLTIVIAGAGGLAWMIWFFAAVLPVYEVTDTARIEAYREAHSIDAPVAGRLARNDLVIGHHFEMGDVVAELDAELERAQLMEEQARLAAIEPELDAVKREIQAREQALEHEQSMLGFAIDEARSHQHEAQLSESLAQTEERRARALFDSGSIAELEMLRTKTSADLRAAQRQAAFRGARRTELDRTMRASMARSEVEELRRDMVELLGKRDISQASIGVLKSRIDRHVLRAGIAGTVADVAEVRPGAFVHEGQKLGAIVPPGTLKIVAAFAPTALGRIKPGQLGRVRLEGFPWIQFGALDATVTRVASEVRDGTVRVELDPVAGSAPGIPLEHGLPGSLEVVVERASPAWLVFRNVGRYVGGVLPERRTDTR